MRKSIRIIISIVTIITFFISCGGSYESEDREELLSSFEDNFGFKPPNTIKKIKLKNWGLHDTDIHYMAFTYDSLVLEKIITHDQTLTIALNNTSEFNQITEEIKKTVHNPKWMKLPNNKTKQIHYKKNFIQKKSFSEYYLWTNRDNGMTYLYVHSFY